MSKMSFKNIAKICTVAMMTAVISAGTLISASAEATPAIDADKVEITNNVGKSDKIYLYGLSPREIIRIYADATSSRRLAAKTLGSAATSTTFTIGQLGAEGGSVYITSILPGGTESERVEVEFEAEAVSEPLTDSDISIVNNTGIKDTITVDDLNAGDKISVYQDSKKSKRLILGKVASSKTSITMRHTQLGADGGVVYISRTALGERESELVAVEFEAESTSTEIAANDVEINNKKGTADKVIVTGVEAGDIIYIYETQTSIKKLSTAKCSQGKDTITKAFSALKKEGGSIYISLKQAGKREGERVKITYEAEPVSDALDPAQVSVTNNPKGTQDEIYIEGLDGACTIKVYKQENSKSTIKSGTVSTNDYVSLKLAQLSVEEGCIWISVMKTGEHESERIPVLYDGEVETEPIDEANVSVINNHGTSDSIRIAGLNEGETVKVYRAANGKTPLATKTITGYSNVNSISIAQLGTTEGKIYLSLTKEGCTESKFTEVSYPAEGVSMAPSSEGISVMNNSGKASTMKVTGLSEYDQVLVYKSESDIDNIGTATVEQYQSEVEVSLGSLNPKGGTIYVSVRSKNLKESELVEVTYGEQASSDPIKVSKVTIVNNAGIADTITVGDRDTGDVINVYSAETGGKLLGSATVSSGSIKAVVSITQLGEDEGEVYISAKSAGLLESARTEVSFEAEAQTEMLLVGNVEIINNSGKADTIIVYGLMPGNTIYVYKDNTTEKALVTAAVPESGASVNASVGQLGEKEGKLYISVKKEGNLESERLAVSYAAESAEIGITDVKITNNASLADIITVSGLSAADIVKVYESSTAANPIAVATSADGSAVEMSVDQLGSNSGSVYISVTNKGRAEGARVQIGYSAEQSTLPLSISQISIKNNVDSADIIEVSGLKAYDTIRVYDLASGGSLLGSGSVGSSQNSLSISVKQLGENAGRVFVTITGYGRTESSRLSVDYVAE